MSAERDHYEQNDFVTVAAVLSETEAVLIKNRLAEAGIHAILSGEQAVGMSGHMSGIFGDIRVQVRADDADEAIALLEQEQSSGAKDADSTAIATPETLARLREEDEDEREEPLSERERNASRAIRAAVFGFMTLGGISIVDLGHDHPLGRVVFAFVFLGLEGYAALLVLRVLISRERLAAGPRTKAKLAAGITGFAFLAFLTMIVMAIVGPIRPGASVDLRKFKHPAVLVGTWEGTYRDPKTGPVAMVMELQSDGRIHYKENGAESSECTGAWAYENWTLFVCFDRFIRGNDDQKGKLLGWPVQDFKDREMFLMTTPEKTRMVRTK